MTASDVKKITIIQLNDVHGHIEKHNETFFDAEGISFKKVGGYARIKTIINETKKEQPNCLVLDCGDTFHGTFITTQTKGNAIIPLMNKMEIDAATAHWDFAYTPSHLRELSNRLNYPILSANTYIYDKKIRLFDPYIIKEVDNLKIAIIGMACEHVVQGFPPIFSEGIYMSPVYAELDQIVNHVKMKEKADFIILLSHLGMPTDYELLKTNKDINVCVSGHTHNRLEKPINIGGALLIQSGCHGSFVTKLDLEIINGKIIDYNHRLIPLDESITEDKEIKQVINQIYDPYKDFLFNSVGYTNVDLYRDFSLASTMDDFLLEAISYTTGNAICFSHGWRYGTPIVKGPITLNDLYNIVPMNPKIINIQLTGGEIYELLTMKINKTYNINPFGQTGGFMQRAIGIKAYVMIENPKNVRIQKLFIQNEECQFDKLYSVSFITKQAVPAFLGQNKQELEITAIDAMIKFLKEKGSYQGSKNKTFEII